MIKSKLRIKTLDIMRFIAALNVMLYHYLYRGIQTGRVEEMDLQSSHFFKYGYLGVNLFFIISGFVIFLSLKNNNNYLTFIKNRIIRLFPTYLISITITLSMFLIFLENIPFDNKTIITNFFMINWIFNLPSIDGVYWSLHIEWVFYILMTGFLLISKKIKIINCVYSWFIIIIILKLMKLFDFYVPGEISFLLMEKYGLLFIAGIFFYKNYISGFNIKDFLILLMCFILSSYDLINQSRILEIDLKSTSSDIILITINLSFFLYFFFLSYIEKLNKFSFAKLGMVSYPMYLIHQELGYILYDYLKRDNHNYNIFLILVIIAIVIVTSIIITEKYEKPIFNYLKTIVITK